MAKKNKKSKKVSKNDTVKKEFQRKANVQYQDSLFRTLFSKKENAIELYNALEGTDYGPDTNIDINTLEEVFFHDRRNDLSFVIDTHYVVMAEQQSTKSMNMPLRLLGYAARTLEKMVPDTAIYSSRLYQFPIPEFYVLYTGEENWDARILRLSDGFLRKDANQEIPENSMELVVKIINVSYNKHNEVIRRSKTLEGYSRLIYYIKEYRKNGMGREEAVDAAITRCISEGFLTEFLRNRKEVSKMILGNNITMEEYGQILAEDARLDGIEIGKKEGGITTLIQDNLEEGFSKERILSKLIRRFNLTEEDAEKFYNQVTQTL